VRIHSEQCQNRETLNRQQRDPELPHQAIPSVFFGVFMGFVDQLSSGRIHCDAP
jgi:hypothetical protein